MYQPPIIDLRAIVLDPEPRRRRRIRRAVAIGAAAFLVPLGVYFAIAPRYRAHRQATVRVAVQSHAVSRNAANPPAKPKTTGRLVYPYSVIAGGAYNIAELARAMDSDPVVARHYGEFDRSKLTTTRSLSVRPVYVSYRVGDTIYWSRKPVRLHLGELLLTDGTNFARARCGNRIALSVQSPGAFSEPIAGILDTPVFVPEAAALPPEEIAAVLPAGGSEIRPAVPYIPTAVARAGRTGWLGPVLGAGTVAGVVVVATNGGSKGSTGATTGTTDSGGGGTDNGGGTITPGGGGGCVGANCGGGGGGCVGANCGGGGGGGGCVGANCGGGGGGGCVGANCGGGGGGGCVGANCGGGGGGGCVGANCGGGGGGGCVGANCGGGGGGGCVGANCGGGGGGSCIGTCGGNPPEVVPEPSFWVPCMLGCTAIIAVKMYRRRGAARG